jgi:hypothetical protein
MGGEILHFLYTKALFYPLVVLQEKVDINLKKSVYQISLKEYLGKWKSAHHRTLRVNRK